MVHVSTPKPSLGAAIGQGIGQGFQKGFENQFQYQTDRARSLEALQQARQSAGQAKSPSDLLFSLLEATAGRPGAERALGQLYPALLQNFLAQKSGEVPLGPELLQTPEKVNLPNLQLTTNPQAINQNSQAPGQAPLATIANQTGQFFPNNLGQQAAPGNLPQAATSGIKRPVYSPDQLTKAAKNLHQTRNAANIPTTLKEAYNEVREANEENKIYNQEIDKELGQRIESQKESGEQAVTKLQKVLPDATDEQQAVFRKIGENKRGESTSEADFDRVISKEAVKFKNMLTNVKKDISAPRLQNSLHRKFLGTEKDFKAASKDLQVKLKPLLDLGLYDTARNMLSDLGYYPEERESVVNDLNNKAIAAINLVPSTKKQESFKKGSGGYAEPFPEMIYTPKDQTNIREGILSAFKADPNISLVLARKGFEDKGYDWRIFKDALNDLVQGEQIKLNDDQFNQLQYLDSPPLNLLEQLLHSIKIIGR